MSCKNIYQILRIFLRLGLRFFSATHPRFQKRPHHVAAGAVQAKECEP
jgi:hypothetical protein